MFIIVIHKRFEKKLYFVEMLQFRVEILIKKLEAQIFKSMHHYMGLSFNNYSQSFKGNLEAYIKIYNERILDLVDLVREKQKRVMSITLANLITLDIHKENAMKNLLVKGAKRINEFDWIAAFNRFTFS